MQVYLSLKTILMNMNKCKFMKVIMYTGVHFGELVGLTFDHTQKTPFPTFFLLYPQQQKAPNPCAIRI